MSIPGCCLSHFNRGENFCPVCNTQREEYNKEVERARQFRPGAADLNAATQELLKARAIPQTEFRPSSRGISAMAKKNPNRRKVFELFGFYLPERDARNLLKAIHDFKWIEAEKVGRDIWSECTVQDPFETAATTWAGKYLPCYMNEDTPEAA